MMENLPQVEWEMVEATQMFPIHEEKHETPGMGRIKVDTRSLVILRWDEVDEILREAERKKRTSRQQSTSPLDFGSERVIVSFENRRPTRWTITLLDSQEMASMDR